MTDRMARNCGECLWNDVNIVELNEAGVCPACGTDYGPEEPDDRELFGKPVQPGTVGDLVMRRGLKKRVGDA